MALKLYPQNPEWKRPGVRLQVAFGSNPFDSPQIYTDLTRYLRDEPIDIRRGKSTELSQFETGELTGAHLNNLSGDFTVENANSPFAGNLKPLKRVRVQAEYPALPAMYPYGHQGSSIADWVANTGFNVLSLTSDIDFGPCLGLSVNATGHTLSFSTGGLNFPTDLYFIPIRELNNGLPHTYTLWAKLSTLTPGRTYGINIQINWVSIYGTIISSVSTTATVSEAQPGTRITFTASNPLNAIGASLSIFSTTNMLATTDVIKIQNVVFEQTSTSFLSTRFGGFVNGWDQTWEGRDSIVPLTAFDLFGMLAMKKLNKSGYRAAVIADGATDYWRLGDGYGSTIAVNEIASPSRDGTVNDSVLMGVEGALLTELNTGAFMGSFQSGGAVNLPDTYDPSGGGWINLGSQPANQDALDTWTIEFWYKATEPPPWFYDVPSSTFYKSSGVFISQTTPGGSTIGVVEGAGGWAIFAEAKQLGTSAIADPDNMTITGSGTSKTLGPVWAQSFNAPIDSIWHHVVITKKAFSGIHQTRAYLDGVEVNTGRNGNTLAIAYYDDTQTKVALGYSAVLGPGPHPFGSLDEIALYDNFNMSQAIAQNHYQLGRAAWAGQTATQRITSVHAAIGYPSSDLDLSTGPGQSLLQAEVASLTDKNVLEYDQLIEQSENGMLFCSNDGRETLVGHQDLIRAPRTTPEASFGVPMSISGLAIAQGAKAHWRLMDKDSVVKDSIGGRDGQYSDALLMNQGGPWNFGSIRLTGSSVSGLQLSNSTAYEGGQAAFTIEAWIRIPAGNSTLDKVIYLERGTAAVDLIRLQIIGTTRLLNFQYRDDTSSLGTITASQQIDDDKWHHVVAMRSGTSANLYVDGVLVGFSFGFPSGSTWTNASLRTWAGNDSLDNRFALRCNIAAIATYHSGFSAGQALAHASITSRNEWLMAVAADTPSHLFVLGGTGIPVDIAGGGTQVGLSGLVLAGSYSFVVSPTGLPAVSFDGVGGNANIGVGRIIAGQANWTISMLIKTSDTGATTGKALYIERAPSGQNLLKITLGGTGLGGGSGKFGLVFRDDAATLNSIFTTVLVNTGVWKHVTARKSGATVSLFINGVFNTSTTLTATDTMTDALQTFIGSDPADATAYYAGQMSEVEVFPRALTNAEILVQATIGLGTSPELPFSSIGYENNHKLVFNEAQGGRLGGAQQLVVDAASQVTYGPRTVPISSNELRLIDDSAVVSLLQWQVTHYAQQKPRLTKLGVDSLSGEAALSALINLEISDRIEARLRPPSTPIGTYTPSQALVLGVRERWFRGQGAAEYDVHSVDIQTYLTYDDPVYGILDGANRYAY